MVRPVMTPLLLLRACQVLLTLAEVYPGAANTDQDYSFGKAKEQVAWELRGTMGGVVVVVGCCLSPTSVCWFTRFARFLYWTDNRRIHRSSFVVC